MNKEKINKLLKDNPIKIIKFGDIEVPVEYLKQTTVNINGDDYIRLQQENQQLKKQLDYLRSGEYLNQLKFERNMLEDIVQNMEVSKEDKKFIDMTHRNTELLEEKEELKKWLEEGRKVSLAHENSIGVNFIEIVLDKIKELEEGINGNKGTN